MSQSPGHFRLCYLGGISVPQTHLVSEMKIANMLLYSGHFDCASRYIVHVTQAFETSYTAFRLPCPSGKP